jgi:hypothetical protein
MFLAPLTVQAADFDGSAPMICALFDLQSCAPDQGCQHESAVEVNLPNVVAIDATAKTVSGRRPNDGKNDVTKIDTVQRSDLGLILQGVDGRRSWTAVIDPEGDLTVASAGLDAGFVIFGQCMMR